jgi:hypothetical protein
MNAVSLNIYVKVVMLLVFPVLCFLDLIFSLPQIKTMKPPYSGTVVRISQHWNSYIPFNAKRPDDLWQQTHQLLFKDRPVFIHIAQASIPRISFSEHLEAGVDRIKRYPDM